MEATKLEIFASYLPHKLKCLVDGEVAELNAVYSDGSCTFFDLVESEKGFDSVKPILMPLSEIDFSMFIADASVGDFDSDDFYHEWIEFFNYHSMDYDRTILECPNVILNWLLKHHCDVYGLLEKGEAVTPQEAGMKLLLNHE